MIKDGWVEAPSKALLFEVISRLASMILSTALLPTVMASSLPPIISEKFELLAISHFRYVLALKRNGEESAAFR